MHDLLAPIVAVILAAIALLGSAVFGYRIGCAAARSRSRRILAEAVALRGSAGRELFAAHNHRATVEATMGAAYVAGWRPARVAVAVEVVAAPRPREAPAARKPDAIDEWLQDEDTLVSSGVQRHAIPPGPPISGVSPLAESVASYERLERGEDTPTTPKDPRS